MEIEKAVQEKFLEIVASGKIEKMISDALEKSISGIVTDCLREYSDFGKTVKENVVKALGLGNMELDFPSYNQLICNHIIEIVNKQIITTSKTQIEKNLKKFFKPLEKSEYKISEIVEEFKKSVFDESDGVREITFIEEKSNYGYTHFFIDKDSDKEKYKCDIQIDIDEEGIIYNSKIDGTDAERIKLKPLYGFDSFVFQLYSAKIKIINDINYVDTIYSPHEDQ